MVVGDVVLDEYVIGTAQRMSREAPVPVLELAERRFIAGGAANPAANLVRLGASAVQVAVTGDDAAGAHLRAALESLGIATAGIAICPGRPTTVKMRVLAQMGLRFPQQVARVDTIPRDPVPPFVTQSLASYIRQHGPAHGALLISDYHGGVLTPDVVQACLEQQARGVLVTVDAQGNLEQYRRVNLLKCNADDARAYLRAPLAADDDFAQAAQQMRAQFAVEALVITRGADGATLATEGQVQRLPAPAVRDVYDTVGAGDTAIAVMTLARLCGATWEDAVRAANYASGIVIQHVGNYTPSLEELQQAINAG